NSRGQGVGLGLSHSCAGRVIRNSLSSLLEISSEGREGFGDGCLSTVAKLTLLIAMPKSATVKNRC
ncbi:hypothetical protein LINGRAHAP2_LOCUS20880, partial [Linum grandiflorum]